MDIIDFSQTFLILIFGTIIITFFGIFFGLIFNGFKLKIIITNKDDKKISLMKPFYDLLDLFREENLMPKNAIAWMFNSAPLIGFVASISILLYLPLAGFQPILYKYGDIILILFLLIFPFLSRAIGGFSSGSKYTAISAKKELATMISYIFPLVIIIISIAWRLSLEGSNNVFSLNVISSTPIWNLLGPLGFIGFIILFVVFIIIMGGGSVDSSIKDSIINGNKINDPLLEYSGKNKAIYNMTESVILIVFATLMITVFFPYRISEFLVLNEYAAYAIELIFYLLKIFILVIISSVIIRIIIKRMKTYHIIYNSWVSLTLMSLVGLIFIMWDQTIMINFELKPVFEMLNII